MNDGNDAVGGGGGGGAAAGVGNENSANQHAASEFHSYASNPFLSPADASGSQAPPPPVLQQRLHSPANSMDNNFSEDL